MDNNIKTLVSQLTDEEKVLLLSGSDFMFTNSVPRLGIPRISMADGPFGIRKYTGDGKSVKPKSEPATAFPTSAAIAAGWNTEYARLAGAAIADEARYYGVDIVLGPGVNIKRNPLCGRNFEYYSEDPLLSGMLAASMVEGIQSHGTAACVKHFALNNAEDYRYMGNSIADMRAMREIYLKSFETVIKKARPKCVMSAYNRLLAVDCTNNKWLLDDVLRGEWGFDGFVMSDWGAMRDRAESLKAGLDLEMPGDVKYCREALQNGMENGEFQNGEINTSVSRILGFIADRNSKKAEITNADFEKHHALAADIATGCAVLMKNDGLLPLGRDEKIFVCGELFNKMRYQGAGSSMINPAFLTDCRDAFDLRGIDYIYAKGYDCNHEKADNRLIKQALRACKDCNIALVFAGLTDSTEGEGADRKSYTLPENQIKLIRALADEGKRVAVILFGGSPYELGFADDVSAILNMYLPGQNGGEATARLVFGEACPAGRLPETWSEHYNDIPFSKEFSQGINEVYKESIFVGYRYYDTAGKPVAFPFGFGLSYTEFEYSDMNVSINNGKIRVECDIQNIGKYDGDEVVQLYVSSPRTDVFKPLRELRAFTRISLKSSETKTACLDFNTDDLRYYNIKENRFVLEGGEYRLQLCRDSSSVILSQKITLEGEGIPSPYTERISKIYSVADMQSVDNGVFEEMSGLEITPEPPVKPITAESRFTDYKHTFFGCLIYGTVIGILNILALGAHLTFNKEKRVNAVKNAVFIKRAIVSNSLRSMSMSAGKMLPYNKAAALVKLANGDIKGFFGLIFK